MNGIVFLSIILSGSFSSASGILLDYHFGNQITASTFIVYQDGVVNHSERTCCPPRTDQIPHKEIDERTLEVIRVLISGAEEATQSKFGIGQSGNGSSAGSFTAFNGEGKPINIRTIEFGDLVGGPQPVTYNVARESRELEKFVLERVQNRMDDRILPSQKAGTVF